MIRRDTIQASRAHVSGVVVASSVVEASSVVVVITPGTVIVILSINMAFSSPAGPRVMVTVNYA